MMLIIQTSLKTLIGTFWALLTLMGMLTLKPMIGYGEKQGRLLSADTVTNTETTFQRENLVTNIIRVIFFIIKGPLIPNLLPNINFKLLNITYNSFWVTFF